MSATSQVAWTAAEAEAHLDSLEVHGWRFGLERIRKLVAAMGLPQHRFAGIHVVGTNGKSSTARMIAAILEAHGLAAGAYLSPHLSSWTERIEVGGRPIGGPALAAAVERAAAAAAAVERSLETGDFVTQFELATAAAFQAFATAGVEAAAIEAGLGGRLDATNVIAAKVTALTSVGLEHTEWLGESEAEIAVEKLAVVGDRSTLVLGALGPQAAAVAERVAAERHATLIWAPADPGPAIEPRAAGAYQRRNFALAAAAAEAFLGRIEPQALAAAAAVEVPGRMELVEGDPPILLDAAHNPDGVRALVESLPAIAAGRPVVCCLAVLAGKDAGAMAAALAPHCERLVCTEAGGGRARPAAELARLCEAAGAARVEALADPGEALDRARELARERGGLALVTGSLYLLGQLWTARRAQS